MFSYMKYMSGYYEYMYGSVCICRYVYVCVNFPNFLRRM